MLPFYLTVFLSQECFFNFKFHFKSTVLIWRQLLLSSRFLYLRISPLHCKRWVLLITGEHASFISGRTLFCKRTWASTSWISHVKMDVLPVPALKDNFMYIIVDTASKVSWFIIFLGNDFMTIDFTVGKR